jgi:DNA-binding transcriptional ArsR family regulator
MEKMLWWLITGTKGGFNRGQIINLLLKRPYNANQLAQKLELDYKTVRHHIKVLEDNNVVTTSGENYGIMYFISPPIEENQKLFQEIWNEIEED